MLGNATERATIESLTQRITHTELEPNPNSLEACRSKP